MLYVISYFDLYNINRLFTATAYIFRISVFNRFFVLLLMHIRYLKSVVILMLFSKLTGS